MKKFLALLVTAMLGAPIAHAGQKSLECKLEGMIEPISFNVPKKAGNLPKLDFSYPINTIIFHLDNSNLLLVAMDQDESSRPRIFISAKYNKKSNTYEGRFMTDSGGNQIQLDSGSVSCQLKS